MARSLAEQIRDKCVHFNGVQNKVCKAGVEYDSVGVRGCGVPCLRRVGKGAELDCDKRQWPTEQEVQDAVGSSRMASARMLAGLAAVSEDAKRRGLGKGHGGRGDVACPVCEGGTIHYSVAGVNGHRHARCTTADCVCFME